MIRVSGSSSSNLQYLSGYQDIQQSAQVQNLVIPSSPCHHDVPILRQAACRVLHFSSQYGGEESAFAYTAQNLAGECRIYPRYGDCSHAAVFRTFDRWWSSDYSKLWLDSEFDRSAEVDPSDLTDDFICLAFSTPVYLKAVEIYETFNVGHVTRVFAGYDAPSTDSTQTQPLQWTLLWRGRPDITLGKAARAFVPPLALERLNGQPVNAIRLEICSNGAEYYPELDAVYIHGYPVPNSVGKEQLYDPPSPIPPPANSGSNKDHVARLFQSPVKSEEAEADLDYHESPVKSASKLNAATLSPARNPWAMWSIQQALQDMQRLSSRWPSAQINLDSLPLELIHVIVGHLPRHDRTRTLARLGSTCKRLYSACLKDPAMHSLIDLKPSWHRVDSELLLSLVAPQRDCTHMRLSWLSPSNVPDLKPFFEALQSRRLQTLLMSCCHQLSDDCLELICSTQSQLRRLDLSSCRQLTGAGFIHLTSLKNLRQLSLYRTFIPDQVLLQVLVELKAMEVLNIGSVSKVTNMDSVAKAIGASMPNLKALDCWRGKSLSHLGLRDLAAGCPLIEELDLGWCCDARSSTSIFRHIAKSMPRLRRLMLTANRTVCDADLDAFSTYLFETLEQLDILGCRDVTANGVVGLLDRCRKLRFLDASFCASIDFDEIQQLRKTFPHCSIKKSYQP